MEMTIIRYPKTCPECGGSTSKRTVDIFICENPGCKHINAEQLFTTLKHFGIDTELIQKVREKMFINSEI